MSLTTGQYNKVHEWLRTKYGLANKCENLSCPGKCKAFHWALRHGKKYEKKRVNFISLCARCHKRYDIGNERRTPGPRDYAWVRIYPKTYEVLRRLAFKKRLTLAGVVDELCKS